MQKRQMPMSTNDSDGTKQKSTKNEEPAAQIDKVAEKIQEVLAAVEALESGK